jgi:hypothetical protein
MNDEKSSRRGRALGLVIASVVATAPLAGCTESHPAAPDAATPVDAAATADGSPSPVDAAAPDAALAMADASTVDAATWEEQDADIPDSYYYPDGIRG